MDTPDTTIVQELMEARKAIVALADGVDLVGDKMYIIQPFLNIYKAHGDTIAEARRALSATPVARASSLPTPVGDWNAAIEAAAKICDAAAAERLRRYKAPLPGDENLGPFTQLDTQALMGVTAGKLADAIRALARPSQEEGK